MPQSPVIALGRDPLVGPDPIWEQLSADARSQWLAEIEDFPLPPLLLELMENDLQFENFDVTHLASRIAGDPVLTARCLARANSAAIAPREPITSLRQAIVHLGFILIRSMLMQYQIEQSAARLNGIVRRHIMAIQHSAETGAVIAYNWARAVNHPDPTLVATYCLLGRLGTFLLARRHPDRIDAYFQSGHEPQRLNFEANHFNITTRSLTYKIAQWWGLPTSMQQALFHLWTPLFAAGTDSTTTLAGAALALSFDPPSEIDDIQKWLALRVHTRLSENLDRCGALRRLPDLISNETYRLEIATIAGDMS